MKKIFLFICLVVLFFQNQNAQVSMNMTLLDNWDQSGLSYNDVWGYVDGSGTEYAILGSRSKIHFFEITGSNTLSLIDEFSPGATSTWRDFKTYGNYAYACTEGNEGLLVYDLSNLPTSVSLSHQITTDFNRAHNIYIDEAMGKLYVVGSNTQSNGLIIYDVTTNPPTHLASVPLPGPGYVHDIYVRNDIAYCSHGNDGFFIWDVETPTSPSVMGSFTAESGYNHSSWVTPDGNTAFYAREVGVGLPMTAIDISNVNDISVISNFKYPLLAPTHVNNVPHNPYLVGDYLYTSYYEDGVQVFDVSDPANVTVAGYYDTYPANTQYNGYNGCWGTYPFLPSGKILGSDGVNGLFLLETNFSSVPPLVLNFVSQTNVSCNSGNNGSLEVTGNAGTPPYTYTVNGGASQSSGVFNNLSAGVYNVEITDNANVVETLDVTITQPNPIQPFITQQQNVSCNGGINGMIQASAVGGTVALNYLYSIDGINFSPSNSFTNLTVGAYILTIRDDNNCEATLPFSISEPNALNSIVNSQTNIDCFGNNTGAIEFSTVGGTQGYLYSLNQTNYQASNIFSTLSAGNYILYTLDANDCTSQTSFTISEPSLLEVSIDQQTNLDCFGDDNGEIILNGEGGTPNYQYSIDGGSYQSSATFSNLSTGSYDFNIKDANDCITSLTAAITAPPEINVQFSQVNHVDCFGESTGSVTLQISGGAGDFSTIMNGNTVTGNTVVFQDLAAGTYPILIEDGNNCTEIEAVTINENSEVLLFLNNSQNITCNGNSDGSISVNVVGGTGGYNYLINGVTNGSNNLFQNLSAGQYVITTIDGLGCEDEITVDISEPPSIFVQLISQTNESCTGANNGSVTVEATGGVGNFQYNLNGINNSTGIFTNLSAGTFNVIILDGNSCVASQSFTIGSADPIAAQISSQTDVDCFGNSTGSVQINASGGTSNYTFELGTQSNTTGLFENLTAGNYTILITDGNNCTSSIPTVISQPNEISPSIASSQNVICFGENNGNVQVQANGGTGNLNFTLGNETNSTGFFENLTVGNYNIEITDANNCQSSLAVEISQPDVITSSISASQNVNCFGENNGSVQVQANGGTGNLNFTLGNEINSTGLFENLSAGNYNIEITDENNCQSTIAANISQPDVITSSISASQNVNCFGENNGSVQVQANGGTGNLNFTLGNEINSTGLFENLAAGNYNIAITDANNCQSTIAANISQPDVITSSISASQNVNCFGENNGSVQVQASGGIGSLNFTLGNETNSTGFFENLTAGNYNIEITDENNCQSTIATNISQPDVITSSISVSQNVNCFGENNGSFQVQASGGTGNLNFTLGNEINTTGLFENLPAGNYNIAITDENNCSSSASIEITEPTELSISTTAVNLASCNGQEGSIQVDAQGGTLLYQFSNGNTTNSNGLFENLASGIYMISVTDANNCMASIEVDIIEPNALNVEITQTQNPLCNGENNGSLQLQANGGTGTITYNLGNETNTTGVFENLTANTYNITVTDENDCTSIIEVELADPPVLAINNNQTTDVNCNGENNGSLNLSATGGTGSLTFSLGNETNSTGIFENLAANTYNITVTDENGCNTSIELSISEPPLLASSILQNNSIACAGENTGMVQFEANGGVGNYEFSMAGITNSTGLFENLVAADYMMNLTDGNGCATSQNVTLTEPLAISIESLSVTNALCNGENSGTVSITAIGGVGQFEFSLGSETNNSGTFENLNAGNYNIIITDENNCETSLEAIVVEPSTITIEATLIQDVLCNGDNSGSLLFNATGGSGNLEFTLANETNASGEFENLIAGMYEVIVTDANDCSNTMAIEINEPLPLETTLIQSQNILCNGDNSGSINLSSSGGTGDIEYTLNNETNSTGFFENLEAGIYEIIANDNNMCTSSLEIEISEPAPINLVVDGIQLVSCHGENDGSISILASGGDGNFTYTLGNETNSTGVFENLIAGTYNIIITDGNDCSDSVEAIISEPQEITTFFEITNFIDCAGDETGAIIASASGGTGDFQYTLGNETNSIGLFENLGAGTYLLSMVDQNNCSTSLEIDINEPQQLASSVLQTQNILCAGEASGNFEITATGGTGTYTYVLNGNSNTTGFFENLTAGTYQVNILDENECEIAEIITLTEPDDLTMTLENSQMADCAGATTGGFEVQAFGGIGNYTYSISNQTNTDGIFENLASGIYDCLVKDENNCTFSLLVTVNENNDIELNEFDITNVDCFENENGSILISVTGGTGDFTFSLGTETNNTGFFQNLPSGIYYITATDMNDCSSIFSAEVTEPNSLEIVTNEIINVDCFGENTGSVQLSASGGTGDRNFSLAGLSNSTGFFENLPAGNYDAIVTDDNNCNNTITFEITEAPELIFSITNLMNDTGSGNGSVTFGGTGGTPFYLFSIDGLDFQQSTTFESLSAGNYIGYIQDANGCVIESPFEIILETSISNPDLGILEMDVFPNPFSEKIIVQMDLAFAQTINLQMINISGQTILRHTENVKRGKQNITLDVESNIPAGIYFLSVKNENHMIGYFKIIKH